MNDNFINVEVILKILAEERPIFHSEADFQHALAWKIHEQIPDCKIRLEKTYTHNDNNRIYLDVLVNCKNTTYAFELKYKTRKLTATIEDEEFKLKDQGAQNQGRYDFLNDVQRLGNLVNGHNYIFGYAIFLTNNPLYWNGPGRNNTYDADFRIHNGRNVHGEMNWNVNAAEGTRVGRNNPVTIQGNYNLNWKPYSNIQNYEHEGNYSEFKYLLVKIHNR